MGHPFSFNAEWNTLLPLVDFIEEAITKMIAWCAVEQRGMVTPHNIKICVGVSLGLLV